MEVDGWVEVNGVYCSSLGMVMIFFVCKLCVVNVVGVCSDFL